MNNQAILETLERLRRNKDYQYLCTHLTSIKDLTEGLIYDEKIDIKTKEALIIKRNIIKLFIELPSDLIIEFTPIKEEN